MLLSQLRQSVYRFFIPRQIQTLPELQAFVYAWGAKHTGHLIIKYAHKRIGKLHYTLSAKDAGYANEIVRCQLKLNAEILSDYGRLLSRLLNLKQAGDSQELKTMLSEAHETYARSCPEWFLEQRHYLTETHFLKSSTEIKAIAEQTGDFLFRLLPATDNLNDSNVLIFRGQVRMAHIDFLRELSKRTRRTSLRHIVRPP